MSNSKLEGLTVDHNSIYYESQIEKEFISKKTITYVRANLDASAIIVPKVDSYPERRLLFKDKTCKDKRLLYRLVVAAYNHCFVSEFSALTAKVTFTGAVSSFVDWLNEIEISNRYSILKDYEAYIFDMRDNHGGASELPKIKIMISHALAEEEFSNSLSAEELRFLFDLKKTKVSPNLNKRQVSIASYFGALDWLRDDDLGCGSTTYNMLASPKLTIKSLRCISSVIILEFKEAKQAILSFMKEYDCLPNRFSLTEFNKLSVHNRKAVLARFMYDVLIAYYKVENPSNALRKGIALVLLSNSLSSATDEVQLAINSEAEFREVFHNSTGNFGIDKATRLFKSNASGQMFSMEFIIKLSSSDSESPITKLESLMFSWLIASFAVQPADIARLKQDNFRKLRVGGKITHIECAYFKSRAKKIHSTKGVSVKKIDGKALVAYLDAHHGNELTTYDSENAPHVSSENTSPLGALYNLLNLDFINSALEEAHVNMGKIPAIMPVAIKKLMKYGVHTGNLPNTQKIKSDERIKLVASSRTPCSRPFFHLQAIKNTSVHAFSDPYTLHYLINHNSHTNKTESRNYLNEDNIEWINASGRITRSVLFDLTENVFKLDFTNLSRDERDRAKAEFNSEFQSVTQSISYKTEEMMSRLRIVTGQDKVLINEVGILSLSKKSEGVFTPIYVLDSPVTVCKMKNYLHEFKRNYKRLLSRNPDFLYKTALPTVEWMENVLPNLRKDSLQKGTELFEKMVQSGVSMRVFHSV